MAWKRVPAAQTFLFFLFLLPGPQRIHSVLARLDDAARYSAKATRHVKPSLLFHPGFNRNPDPGSPDKGA